YFRADPMLPYRFEKDGDYYVEIRDARLQGSPAWIYRLSLVRRPVVTGAFPVAATRGSQLEVQPVGLAVAQLRPARVELPADLAPGAREVRFEGPGGMSAPVPLQVSDLPEAVEAEPNDTYSQGNRIQVPGGVSGRIGAPFDLDHFVFHADRGQALVFEVEAARLGSSLDAQLALLDTRGRGIAGSEAGAGGAPRVP